MLKENIGKRVKELRLIKLGISQYDFAKKINLDRTYLSRVESGKQNITIEKINEICLGLNITLSEFFSVFNDRDSF